MNESKEERENQIPNKNIQLQVSSCSPVDDFERNNTQISNQGLITQLPLYSSMPPQLPPPPAPQYDPAISVKRPRYTSANEWELLPSSVHQQKLSQMAQLPGPSPSPNSAHLQSPQTQYPSGASSSDTASSPATSPPQPHLRKGKHVSPVWKPHEMLWLARAWHVQYNFSGESRSPSGGGGRGKLRAEKDKEVATFLNSHGVNRDVKTAATKWDNMIGEFRKVYEWERPYDSSNNNNDNNNNNNNDNDNNNNDHDDNDKGKNKRKSYFRMSGYERKLNRLPAAFDEEVFEELCRFMGGRMRLSLDGGERVKSLISPAIEFHEDHVSPSEATPTITSGPRGFLEMPTHHHTCRTSSSKPELRRIGKVKMTWEELVSLWAEEGDPNPTRGRVRVHGGLGLGFVEADEVTYFDESQVACTLESFEAGPLKGLSIDNFAPGQHLKVFGRRRKNLTSPPPLLPAGEFQDPTDHYIGNLQSAASPPSLPPLSDLGRHLHHPLPPHLQLPLRHDTYRSLPHLSRDIFFTVATDPFSDCNRFAIEILGPLIRPLPNTTAVAGTRDSFIGLWDDCVNRVVSKFCPIEVSFIRKEPSLSKDEHLLNQWPNLTGFVKGFCLWRAEETHHLTEYNNNSNDNDNSNNRGDPSVTIAEKILWTFADLPYVLGYYAVGYVVTFYAMARTQDRVVRTDLCTLDLSNPSDRVATLVPCFRIAGLLPLLADKCIQNGSYSDFERIHLKNSPNGGFLMDLNPTQMIKFYENKEKWAKSKEIYDLLGYRIPHAEICIGYCEKDLKLVFNPRGVNQKPRNYEQLVEALKHVTKALVALHDLGFLHRDLRWGNVMRKPTCDNGDEEREYWFLCGFEEAVGAPQIHTHGCSGAGGGGEVVACGRYAPEMGRGVYGVKVDVWGVGYLVRTCGLSEVPEGLRELERWCSEMSPKQRPTAADCYHHLSRCPVSVSGGGGGGGGGGSY